MNWYEKSKLCGRFRRLCGKDRELTYNSRKMPTEAETILWEVLRKRSLGGYRFRQQHKIGRFVVDFYCHETSLVIEADGSIHDDRKEYDRERDEWLSDRGFYVLHISNEDILYDVDKVKQLILFHLGKFKRTPSGG